MTKQGKHHVTYDIIFFRIQNLAFAKNTTIYNIIYKFLVFLILVVIFEKKKYFIEYFYLNRRKKTLRSLFPKNLFY